MVLKSIGGEEIIVDHTQERRPIKANLLLTLGLAFRKNLAETTSAKRVGIVLPPGIGATVANLACILGDKIPVNLNFSLGQAALESCVRRAQIDTLITTEQVQKRCPNLPKTSITLDIKEELKALAKEKFSLGITLGMLKIMPASLAASFFSIPKKETARKLHSSSPAAALVNPRA